ncbi:hypothetical protein F2Q70_00011850 [Brassica cretica]|uniref:Uncharacterized protein n=1 Tax=Brassica cretica TaxID=69181 RepID=A0A8S9M479_BRACR|nr:hypothetical protein F2Q70_00011850 [Brassica cretica]
MALAFSYRNILGFFELTGVFFINSSSVLISSSEPYLSSYCLTAKASSLFEESPSRLVGSRKHGKQPTQLSWSSPWVAPGEIEAELTAILKETTPRLDMSEYTTDSVRNPPRISTETSVVFNHPPAYKQASITNEVDIDGGDA